ACSDYDQQFGANVAHQMPQTDSIPIRNGPEDETDEQDTGQIELADHCAQRDKGAYTESAYGEADGAHRADRSQPHDVANDLEHNSLGELDHLQHRLANRADRVQSEGEQHRKKYYLQHIAFGEGRDRSMGHDAQEKTAAADLLGGLEIRIDCGSGNRLQIDMHAAAGPEEIDHSYFPAQN